MARNAVIRSYEGIRITRHTGKLDAGWSLHIEDERVAWFRNAADLARWVHTSFGPQTAHYLTKTMKEM